MDVGAFNVVDLLIRLDLLIIVDSAVLLQGFPFPVVHHPDGSGCRHNQQYDPEDEDAVIARLYGIAGI